MPALAANGETIHYVTEGSGPAVALIHSLGSSVHMWKQQIAALKGTYTMIAVDCRGHGGSSANGQASVADAAGDLKAVLDHLGVPVCHLVGIGMGASIALSFHGRWAPMVRSLVLADAAAKPGGDTADFVTATREAIAYISMQEFGTQYAAQHLMPTTAYEVQDELAEAVAKVDPKTYVQTMQSAMLGSFVDLLPMVKVPSLVIVGENDAPRSTAEFLVENIAGATLDVIPDAGPLSNLDNPAAFNAALSRFLDAHTDPGSR